MSGAFLLPPRLTLHTVRINEVTSNHSEEGSLAIAGLLIFNGLLSNFAVLKAIHTRHPATKKAEAVFFLVAGRSLKQHVGASKTALTALEKALTGSTFLSHLVC